MVHDDSSVICETAHGNFQMKKKTFVKQFVSCSEEQREDVLRETSFATLLLNVNISTASGQSEWWRL